MTLLPVSDAGSLVLLAATYAAAGVFSGLSGFGFAAVGSLSMIALSPQLAVPLLMVLSFATQAASLRTLWAELRPVGAPWHRPDGVLPYLLGGLAGMPVGLSILTTSSAELLKAVLGLLLVGYASWSLLRPAKLALRALCPNLNSALLVGLAGGVVGGFSAFPGSALVVWNGLTGRSKEQSRALTQPFILFMQVIGLSLLFAARPELFDSAFCVLLVLALPIALLGNGLGVAIYRKTGDRSYRRVTLIALGLAGTGLLLKAL